MHGDLTNKLQLLNHEIMSGFAEYLNFHVLSLLAEFSPNPL